MSNFVYIAASLDGFIATPGGGIEWLEDVPNPAGSDFGFGGFIQNMDALVMGRNTFEKVRSFDAWPYAIPVFVLSKTLVSVSSGFEGKVEILSGAPPEVVSRLNSRGFRNLYIDGGKMIQSFLSHDLIDELIVTRFPKLLGKGIKLFGELETALDFDHIETEVIENYLVKSHYRRRGTDAERGRGGNG